MENQSFCLCDLAPFHALKLLSEAEQLWVNEQLKLEPAWVSELEEFQDAVTALAYGAPDVAPAPTLKARLFERIGEPLPDTAPSPPPSPAHTPLWAFQEKDLRWQPHPVPGVEVAIMHLDKASRTVVGMLRAQPGLHYPMHRHAGLEEIYMLHGDLRVGDVVYGPGDYLRSASGSSHGPTSEGGCQFFFRACLDDEFLETIPTVTSA
jgi:hypothetical protein